MLKTQFCVTRPQCVNGIQAGPGNIVGRLLKSVLSHFLLTLFSDVTRRGCYLGMGLFSDVTRTGCYLGMGLFSDVTRTGCYLDVGLLTKPAAFTVLLQE